jgi:hypothetical protein
MSRPIYGSRINGDSACNYVHEIPLTAGLSTLLAIVKRLKLVVDRLYNPMVAVSNVEGEMKMTAAVNTTVYVRLRWLNLHPGEKFNKYEYSHVDGINGIKWIYSLIGRDWRKDPLFKNFTPPWATCPDN